MTGVRYKIPMLSAKAILAYAKPVGEDIYSLNLNKAETAERTEEARRFLCAWCSLPYEAVSNKALAFHTFFPELTMNSPKQLIKTVQGGIGEEA